MNAMKESAADRSRREMYRLQLATNPEQADELAGFVEACAEEQGWDHGVTMKINLALEEIIVNSINYGFPDGRVGHILVVLAADPEQVDILIEDDGDAFDPFSKETPDLSLDIENRPIGGLGIHFVRTCMDAWSYSRRDGFNRIMLRKRLAPSRIE
jgi:serine/threonine-protein kinase RsbW